MASALQTRDLRRRFGAFTAVDGVSLDIEAGARHAIIGPNGAGKTTLINLITGTLRPDGGDVLLGGERVTGVAPHARVKRGLARTFQINTLFPQLTVAESVALAIGERRGHGRDWLRPVAAQRAVLDEARELLRSLQLEGDARGDHARAPLRQAAPAGDRARAGDAARACCCSTSRRPACPSGESQQLIETIERLPAEMAILLIEHDMSLVFRFARRITVMVAGRVLTEGSPAEIAADARVREVYLGEERHG